MKTSKTLTSFVQKTKANKKVKVLKTAQKLKVNGGIHKIIVTGD